MPRGEVPREAARLLRPDGSVLIPPEAAADVLRRLSRDVAAEARANGGVPSGGAYRVMWALFAAARRHDEESARGGEAGEGSVAGTPVAGAASVEIGISEFAQQLGCSASYARRLARSGRVQARRVGHTWLITPDRKEQAA